MSEQISRTLEKELSELDESLQQQRERALGVLLRGIATFGGLAVLGLTFTAFISNAWIRYIPFAVSYLILLITMRSKRLGHDVRVLILVFLVYALGVYIIQMNGLDSSGSWFLLLAPFLAFVMLGDKAGNRAMAVSALIYLFFAVVHYLELPGWVAIELPYSPTTLRQVINMGVSFILIMAAVGLVLRRVAGEQAGALERIRRHIVELNAARQMLEERAAELSRANKRAQKRAWQLQAAAEVLRATRGISNLDALLREAVRSFHARFREYEVDQVSVYMLPTDVATARQQGAEGALNIRATAGSKPPTTPEIVKTVLHSGNADMEIHESPPATEIALPLRGRGGTVREAGFEGIIYIHSPRTDVFFPEDLPVLQVLADQLSIVIQNVILLQRTQAQLREMRMLYRQYSQEVWRSITERQKVFRYDRTLGDIEVSPLEEERIAASAQDALQKGQLIVAEEEPEKVSLALPIKVRDTVIGVVHAEGRVAGGLSRDQITLAETLVSQLALALDSARLFQEAQRRAARERLTGEITARMRETLDVDTVLKTAADEVRRALGLPEVVIRLASSPSDGD